MEMTEPQITLAPNDESDFGRLLLSHRNVTLYEDPFFHGYIDNYLSEPFYCALLPGFPKNTLRINYESKATLDSTAPALGGFWRRSPLSKNLLSFFASTLFLQDLQEIIGSAIARHRGHYDHADWYCMNDWVAAARSREGKPVRVTFKFSRLSSGGWIPPHTDNPCKLLSFILYFAESDWPESYGGGTEIYEPRAALLRHNWRNVEMPFEAMKHRRIFAFVPNRLVFFLKSKNSWHGVSPISCPDGRSRKSLLMTLHDRPYQPENEIHTAARSLIRAWMRVKGYPQHP